MGIESDHPVCPDCDEVVKNDEESVSTPVGVYHRKCDYPDPEDLL